MSLELMCDSCLHSFPVASLPPPNPVYSTARVIFLKMILLSLVELSCIFLYLTHTHTHTQSLKGPFSSLTAFISSFNWPWTTGTSLHWHSHQGFLSLSLSHTHTRTHTPVSISVSSCLVSLLNVFFFCNHLGSWIHVQETHTYNKNKNKTHRRNKASQGRIRRNEKVCR